MAKDSAAPKPQRKRGATGKNGPMSAAKAAARPRAVRSGDVADTRSAQRIEAAQVARVTVRTRTTATMALSDLLSRQCRRGLHAGAGLWLECGLFPRSVATSP